MFEFYQIKLG